MSNDPTPSAEPVFKPFGIPGIGSVVGFDAKNYIVDCIDVVQRRYPCLGEAPTVEAAEADILAFINGTNLQIEAVEIPLAEHKTKMLFRLAERRYEVETGGVVADGVPVRTDRESQAQIGNSFAFLSRNPSRTVKWKGADGVFSTINLAALSAVVDIVGDHVQRCFAHEADLAVLIEAAESTEALMAVAADVEAFELPAE